MTKDVEARLADLERKLEELSDREAIRNIIHRYCRAADRCDLEAFKACYWPDGHDDHGFFGGNAQVVAAHGCLFCGVNGQAW